MLKVHKFTMECCLAVGVAIVFLAGSKDKKKVFEIRKFSPRFGWREQPLIFMMDFKIIGPHLRVGHRPMDDLRTSILLVSRWKYSIKPGYKSQALEKFSLIWF